MTFVLLITFQFEFKIIISSRRTKIITNSKFKASIGFFVYIQEDLYQRDATSLVQGWNLYREKKDENGKKLQGLDRS